MSAFANIESITPRRVWDGVDGRLVEGERLTVGIIELSPGSVVPEHRHGNEQVGFVIDGSVTFTVGDETAELSAGGTYVIPSDVPHSVIAGGRGAVVADVFAPVREDWKDLGRLPATTPRWPAKLSSRQLEATL